MMVRTCRRIVALSVGVFIGWGLVSAVTGITNAAHGATCKRAKHEQSTACVNWTIANPPANPTRTDLEAAGIPVTRWFALGRCEQPGNGVGGVQWTQTGRFIGGLGFYSGTYGAYKPKAYPWPPAASPWQIIIVAERVKADVGITAWGCHGAF